MSNQRLDHAASIMPHPRQVAWQRTEFYAFVHFGINTMTDMEWGLGNEDPSIFKPDRLDARSWVEAFKAAGMKGLILTCKHHDGFCLWPSALTDHSVAASPWRGGKGDVVAEVAQACHEAGFKFGVYLSPWDRADARYGTGQAYDDYFIGQMTELLTNYGPVFELWFDGACGEGQNGKSQDYDWQRIYAAARALQPDTVISVCGPDVRWCGNEAGATRPNEWSVVPQSLRSAELVANQSQKVDDGAFARLMRSGDEDLGGKNAISDATDELVWYPAEVNTSIRPGWFYHEKEDEQVRSADDLFAIYRRSVGGNSTFLLNVPPRPDGLIADADRRALAELGRQISGLKTRDIAWTAQFRFSSAPIAGLASGQRDDGVVWRPDASDIAPSITLTWSTPQSIAYLVLEEDFEHGQLIETAEIWCRRGSGFEHVANTGCIGYRRILDMACDGITGIRIVFTDCRSRPRISGFGVVEHY